MRNARERVATDFGSHRARLWWCVVALCAFVIVAVIVFDVMHRLYYTDGVFPAFKHWRFNADSDQGVAEMSGYLQSLVAHGLLLYLGVTLAAWTHVVLGQAMLVVFLDDYLRLHETMSETFIELFSIEAMFGLRPMDIGELVAWVLLATPIVVLLGLAWRHSDERARKQTKVLLGGLAILVFFAVIVDMTAVTVAAFGIEDGALGWQGRVFYVLTLIESIGELAGQSIVLLSAFYYVFERLTEGERAAGKV